MYRTCIFCSGGLGGNEALEAFPVGRMLAFDGWRGRLWAVCPRCARWNLAPIEERWEAVESAERLFTGARLRVQSENIGLARLPDGTRLVRVGRALPGELAAWRYGEQLVGRRRRHLAIAGVATAAGLAVVGGGLVAGFSLGGAFFLWGNAGNQALRYFQRQRPVTRLDAEGGPVVLRRWHLDHAHLHLPGGGAGEEAVELRIPYARRRTPPTEPLPRIAGPSDTVVLRGAGVRGVLGRAMVGVNRKGASREGVRSALAILEGAGSAGDYVRSVARRRSPLTDGASARGLTPHAALALEMALHEESERRALEGELSMLEAAWREAEEIAAIADALPDDPLDRLSPSPPGAEKG